MGQIIATAAPVREACRDLHATAVLVCRPPTWRRSADSLTTSHIFGASSPSSSSWRLRRTAMRRPHPAR
jgi:hypothetical protein